MKKNLITYFSIVAIVIAVLITGYLSLAYFSFQNGFSSVHGTWSSTSISVPRDRDNDTAFGGLDYALWHSPPDSMPYGQARIIQERVNRIQQNINIENEAILASGLRVDFLEVISMNKYPEDIFRDRNSIQEKPADSLKNTKSQKDNARPEQDYFLALIGFPLKDLNSRFYISNGRYYLKYVEWDSTTKVGDQSRKWGHYVSKQIPVRYAPKEKKVLIPISERQYNIATFVVYSLILLECLTLVYVLLGLPVQLMINLSRGKAFIPQNVVFLKQAAVTFFAFFVIEIISPYLLRGIFSKYIPADFASPNLIETIISHLYLLVLAILAFMFGTAFKKGIRLQEEQDLTV